jgi:hypothetical protein
MSWPWIRGLFRGSVKGFVVEVEVVVVWLVPGGRGVLGFVWMIGLSMSWASMVD